MRENTEHTALEGVRVIDLTQFIAGPLCTVMMAQLGADVIKIEPPTGEQGRRVKLKQNNMFNIMNCNKRCITLNLKEEEGKKILTELIKKGDVIVENYAPGTIEKLGFGYEKIKEINPRIIFCQIKGYSEFSPYANYSAMDAPAQCMGTIACQTGILGLEPVISNVDIADDSSGRAALTGILAALYQREKTGKGQSVRINMQDILVSMSRGSYIHNKDLKRGAPMTLVGKKAPRDLFKTKPEYEDDENNYIFIMCNDTPGQKMWKTLCETIDHPELFDDPRFVDGEHRFENNAVLKEIISEWTSKHTKAEAMKLLCDNKLIAGAVMATTDIIKSPDMYETGMLYKMQHPYLGEILVQGSPYHMSESYVTPTPARDTGEDNVEVYSEVLGFSEEKVKELKEKGVI